MHDPKREKELGDISGITLMALDVTDPHEIESVAAQVVGSGGVDVVFNNAGYGLGGALEGLTDEQILRLVNTNLLGTIRTTKAFIPHFPPSSPPGRADYGSCRLKPQASAGLLERKITWPNMRGVIPVPGEDAALVVTELGA
jgi:NAD(P)-dependent dehydrogenase (short-subunit alcohol dehydrogenase family)